MISSYTQAWVGIRRKRLLLELKRRGGGRGGGGGGAQRKPWNRNVDKNSPIHLSTSQDLEGKRHRTRILNEEICRLTTITSWKIVLRFFNCFYNTSNSLAINWLVWSTLNISLSSAMLSIKLSNTKRKIRGKKSEESNPWLLGEKQEHHKLRRS